MITAGVLVNSTDSQRAINLREVIADELETIRVSHEHATITVATEIPDVAVRADELLESVFRNLLQNAILHNDNDLPEVTVSIGVTDKSARIAIADNGPGVPNGQKDDIFGQGEKGLDSPGTGLGLYLVHTLVEDYGGEIWVEDSDPDGAVFIVELPTTNAGSLHRGDGQ